MSSSIIKKIYFYLSHPMEATRIESLLPIQKTSPCKVVFTIYNLNSSIYSHYTLGEWAIILHPLNHLNLLKIQYSIEDAFLANT